MARFELVPGEKRGVVCCALWRRLYQVNGRRTDEAREEHVRALSFEEIVVALLRLPSPATTSRLVSVRTATHQVHHGTDHADTNDPRCSSPFQPLTPFNSPPTRISMTDAAPISSPTKRAAEEDVPEVVEAKK